MTQARTRLLFLITQFETGGVQHQLDLRIRHLDRERYEIGVLVLTSGSSYLFDRLLSRGIQVECLNIESERHWWRRVLRIQQAIAKFDPHVVDSLLGWDTTYGNIAATLARVPLIIAELQNERRAVRRSYSRSFRVLEWIALRFCCDRIVCCSHGVRRSYRWLFPGFQRKSVVIHDAIEGQLKRGLDRGAERRRLGLPEDGFVVGTIGRLAVQKDQETLIRAAARVCAARPDATFVIGGYGPLRDRHLALIESQGLSDRIRMVGEVTDPCSFYNMVDVFALTSRWEGFPVVLLEAMAYGRPVVSTKVGGIDEMVEHNRSGLLCAPGDDAAIAAGILDLAGDAERRSVFGLRGRYTVLGQFSIDRLIVEWKRIYDSVVVFDNARASQGSAPVDVPVTDVQPVPATPAARAGKISRVLVLRLCPLDRFHALVGRLKEEHPGAVIDAVVQSSAVDPIARHGLCDGLVPYGEGQLSLMKLGLPTIVRLRSRRYDLVVVPYNAPNALGYLQAEVAALGMASGRAIGWRAWDERLECLTALGWSAVLRDRLVAIVETPAAAFRLLQMIARGICSGAARQWTPRQIQRGRA